ncbi:GNAT family N-acetyltransferase [Marivibrio halodurans]|uniref:GNAT family N-acetyltransferase n=1 Tax=Marivibrio halodurans TaxID=2039722 RepID=A0A8J7RZZ4_9PROT|nr:N-acetyltransferase [Marivibrio halodurans]MBP5857750.1 GNAT family N-acetyltransferase [Marivibrio halodurans]
MADIRAYEDRDWPAVWAILQPIFDAGDSYPYPGDIAEEEARRLWTRAPEASFVAEEKDAEGSTRILATYFLKPNQSGRGAHVCNCGYATDPAARGKGLATALCRHSQDEARARGYRAMQFNFVVATNVGAVRLWQREGFAIVGTLPGAFAHPTHGFVDAHVMFKRL